MNNGFTTAVTALCAQWTQRLRTHPQRVAAGLAAVLLTGGGGAFAVASLGPDPADWPVTTVEQNVPSLVEGQTLASLSDGMPSFSLYRSDLVRSSDTPESLLQRLGVADPEAAAFLRSNNLARQQLLGRSNRQVTAEANNDHQLLRLSARWAHDESGNFTRLVIDRQAGKLDARLESAPLTLSSRLAGATIQSSLFAASDSADIPDNVAIQLAEIFSGSIDFRRALRKGDYFSVVYETLEADGAPLRSGRVLSAEFHNHGKTHQAFWFQAEGAAKGGYYDAKGQSLQRTFLSSPLAFTRVTSGFKMRFHPILQTWRAHLGTDFAAPTGTPVRTVGDGKVSFAGVQNGFGNVVFVQHGGNHETVYAHLSRIDVKKGESVTQGQTLGAVGSTGWATGPHLHYEVRVGGQQRDPMATAQQSAATAPLTTAQRAAFERMADMVRKQLEAAPQIHQASAQ